MTDIAARLRDAAGKNDYAIPREDLRREDLIVAIDQAYSENHDTPRMLTRKDFMQ